jgi:hypothetical protein
MDGYEATKILRTEHAYAVVTEGSNPGGRLMRDIPVIAMTASAIQGFVLNFFFGVPIFFERCRVPGDYEEGLKPQLIIAFYKVFRNPPISKRRLAKWY